MNSTCNDQKRNLSTCKLKLKQNLCDLIWNLLTRFEARSFQIEVVSLFLFYSQLLDREILFIFIFIFFVAMFSVELCFISRNVPISLCSIPFEV